MLGMPLIMSFLFGCDGGLRRSFLGQIFFGWDGRLRQSFSLGQVASEIDIYKRVLCRTNGFLSTDFFFFLFLLDLDFLFLSDFNCLRYGIFFCLALSQLVCLEVHSLTRGVCTVSKTGIEKCIAVPQERVRMLLLLLLCCF